MRPPDAAAVVNAPLPAPASLDDRHLVAQLICVELRDYDGDPVLRRRFLEDLEEHRWGGVIVFGGELDAVVELIEEADERVPIPLIVTGDFERGLGQQFPDAGTLFPPPMALGAAGDPALARDVGRALGLELAAARFHVDFAPVADLASEPSNPIIATRGVGDDPAAVAEIVGAFVEGLQSAGVAAAIKHFPGHGRTTTDSHHSLPVVDVDRSRLEVTDWVPFRAGLSAGTRIVMTTHVAFPRLEPDGALRPATFSSAVNAILKEEWGFGGVVCSDALMMGALSGESPARAARNALDAGVDWLLYPPDPMAVIDGVAGDLARGALDRRRCEDAASRLLELKAWAGVGRVAGGRTAPDRGALAETLAATALTADPSDPPGDAGWPDRAQWTVVLDGEISRRDVVIADELDPEAASRVVYVDTTAAPEAVEAAISESRSRSGKTASACAVFSPVRAAKGRAGLSDPALRAVEAALAETRESVLLIFSNPRIVAEVGAPSRVVWTYGEDPSSQRAAVAFLRGALPARGQLPVQISR